MKRLLLPVILLITINILCIAQHALAVHTYYVSANGSNGNDGSSIAKAWRSIAKVNSTIFSPGDKILFEGGEIFYGNVRIDNASGTGANPVVISSYGKQMAVIDAGGASGIVVHNCSNIKISGLHFKGNGVNANTGSGIMFYSDRVDKQCNNIVIDGCIAEGFNQYGILISCAEGENIKGYNNVLITNCIATANGEGGIASSGGQTSFHHTNIHITQCRAFLNKGIPSKTTNHSGNGIVMSSVEHLLIDHCLAYENGADNHCTAGGPVGIWMWLCKDGIIEHCESHHNHAGLNKDGGGFDIDGGCNSCILQYNYSHDNEGAGYLLAEYGAGLPFTNNTVRFNISQNDGRKNGYGAISFWGVNDAFKVTNTYVYNNTVFVNGANVVNGIPAAVMALGNHFSHVIVANNVFLTNGSARFLNSDAPLDTDAILFLSNNYFSYNNAYLFNYNNVPVHSIKEWLQHDDAQEMFHGKATYLSTDPYYTAAGSGKTVGNTLSLSSLLTEYHISGNHSSNKAVNLYSMYAWDIGGHDFYENMLTKQNRNFAGSVLK